MIVYFHVELRMLLELATFKSAFLAISFSLKSYWYHNGVCKPGVQNYMHVYRARIILFHGVGSTRLFFEVSFEMSCMIYIEESDCRGNFGKPSPARLSRCNVPGTRCTFSLSPSLSLLLIVSVHPTLTRASILQLLQGFCSPFIAKNVQRF